MFCKTLCKIPCRVPCRRTCKSSCYVGSAFQRFINYAFGLAPFTITVEPGEDQESLIVTIVGQGGYLYDVSTDGGATFDTVNQSGPTITIEGLDPNTEYDVVVRAHTPGAASSTAPEVTESTYATCAALTFAVGTETDTTVPLNTIATIAGTYDVSYDGGLTFPITGQSGVTYTITGLTPETEYDIVLRHHCTAGGYTDSAVVVATTTA